MLLIGLGVAVAVVSGWYLWAGYYQMLCDIDDRNSADGF